MLLEAETFLQELLHEVRPAIEVVREMGKWLHLQLRFRIEPLKCETGVVRAVLHFLAEPHGIEEGDVDALADWAEGVGCIADQHNVGAVVESIAVDRLVDVAGLLLHKAFNTLVRH